MRPTIYKLAADRKYEEIPLRVQSHPDDLRWTDRYGSTALHILCQARAVDNDLLAAVEAILRVAPDQVAQPNVATWSPLHFAVEKRLVWGGDRLTTALILRLIKACPAAVSVRTQSGFKTKTPFHIACEADAEYIVLKTMLTVNPALATEPYVKKDIYSVVENPLQLLWKNHDHYSGNDCSQQQTKEKMALLLKAAHYGTVQTPLPNKRSFRLLNAACSVRCPRDYFTRVLRQNLDQVGQPDENGLMPLYYCIINASPDSQAYTQFVVQALLEACPKSAAVPDPATGRVPLHVAVSDALMTWHKGGVRELTFACPDALRKRDPASQLVPFLASGVVADKSRLHLSTTYELLLAAPEMVQFERSVQDDRNSARLLSERWTVVEE
jgi:ankyrin repeat protein